MGVKVEEAAGRERERDIEGGGEEVSRDADGTRGHVTPGKGEGSVKPTQEKYARLRRTLRTPEIDISTFGGKANLRREYS